MCELVRREGTEERRAGHDGHDGAFGDGAWQKAYEGTLGKGGGETPAKPTLDSCS